MTKRILIVDADETFARHLTNGLSKLDAFIISVAATLQEASNVLSRDVQDLAFIPVAKDARAVHTLRALQPGLRLILTKPTTQYKVPDAFSGKVQGVLIKPLLEIDLETVLQSALTQPVLMEASRFNNNRLPAYAEMEPLLDTAVIISMLQQANLGRLVHTAVFSRGRTLLAFWGELDEAEAATIALQAGRDWEDVPNTVQIQFSPLPPRFEELMLYTRIVTENYLLTLVALPETPLREVRLRINRLSISLSEVLQDRISSRTSQIAIDTGLLGKRKSYAIVWRPVRPLPRSLHIPLRRALERIAIVNACVITHISVQAELIHLVVLCPPARDSGWAAYLFKNGSEATIQQEFGVDVRLWETGFYTSESTDPLTEAELSIFLAPGQ